MKKVAIIGLGRFGSLLYEILKEDFEITVYSKNPDDYQKLKLTPNTYVAKKPKDVYQTGEVIFYAVPINEFENVIKSHKKYFKPEQLLIDVLSVKMHPKKIFNKYLKGSRTEALLTHPMFGPDSVRMQGLRGQPLIFDKFKSSASNYTFWKRYFQHKGLKIIELTATEHDKLAARSQGITHFLGRILEKFAMKPTPIDSLGSRKLLEVMDQTTNDTWELFRDLQNYNPYTKQMRLDLGKAYDALYNRLLPDRVDKQSIVFGIQGGKASFNEEAILTYIKNTKIKHYKIKYLYTSEKVLANLHSGNIDFGIFAIQNSVGGIVEESVYAMSNYKFRILEEIKIPVRHFLMKRKDTDFDKITAIMAHPQVFKQCSKTLAKRYQSLKQVSGTGDLIDTARAAKALSNREISTNTAILGPESLSDLYNLEIVAHNLQDDPTNLTSFLLVSK